MPNLLTGFSELTKFLIAEEWWQDIFKAKTNNSRAAKQTEIGIPPGAVVGLIDAIYTHTKRAIVIFTPTRKSALEIFSDLVVWRGGKENLYLFAETDYLPEQGDEDFINRHLRLATLDALVRKDLNCPPIVVAPAEATSHKLMALDDFRRLHTRINQSDKLPQNTLIRQLVRAGYRSEALVQLPGTFSRRGSIVDIFPINAEYPTRVEYFGEEIEQLRLFVPSTQRSKNWADFCDIPPAHEIAHAELDKDELAQIMRGRNWSEQDKNTILNAGASRAGLSGSSFYNGFFNENTLFDYLTPDTLKIALNLTEIKAAFANNAEKMNRLVESSDELNALALGGKLPFCEHNLIQDKIDASTNINITQWGLERSLIPLKSTHLRGNSLDDALDIITQICKSGKGNRLLVASAHAPRLAEALPKQIKAKHLKKLSKLPAENGVVLLQTNLSQGFSLNSERLSGELIVLTDTELFSYTRRRTFLPRMQRARLSETHLDDLKEGMYVVHETHGIARFVGTTVIGAEKGEFLILEYAEQDKLYVPVGQIESIELYQNPANKEPKLTRLGSPEWTRAKTRAGKAAALLAGELLTVSSMRQVHAKKPCEPDTPWQLQMETTFPYEETPDQIKVIGEIKRDMESAKPMDRLVCGDAGYGKTEVVLRAAFKAATNGRQVAVLTPTTLLAKQHHETFCERLRPFPLKVELLSSLQAPKQQKKILLDLAEGKTDIVIGTHRLIQVDVQFKNLGLLVIDEEHRFGVVQKERLKQIRADLDVTSLSATPIPRTLNMAISGVRDISTIETPPSYRLPVRTFILEHSPQVIREAILRELNRDGQVFWLHNYVRSLPQFAKELRKLVPEARIAIAHGQMEKNVLENTVSRFRDKEFDVLACTTIIEAGIDMPNVNTLIVERADKFGLAQLYQIRGRVGRGHARGYAYFLLRRGQLHNEKVHERLEALIDATETGAGFKIAMRDLQIRGAGNILGDKQSGHIISVGIGMYSRILKQAIADATNKKETSDETDLKITSVEIDVPANIPISYIENTAQRFNIYRRMTRPATVKQVDELKAEIIDRFGAPPPEVDTLLAIALLKVIAKEAGVSEIRQNHSGITIVSQELIGSARLPLQKTLGEIDPDVRVGPRRITIPTGADVNKTELVPLLISMVKAMIKFREHALSLIEQTAASPPNLKD